MKYQKVFQICRLVADAFNIQNPNKSKTLYHIDGNVNNDNLTNLTFDEKETEKYIEEQRKIKEEQEKLEREKQQENNKKIIIKEQKKTVGFSLFSYSGWAGSGSNQESLT